MKKLGKGNIFIICGLILIVAALIWLGVVLWQDHAVGKKAEETAEYLTAAAESTADEEFTPDYILNPNMELPIKVVDGNEYVGTLTIPDLELTLPVLNGWSYKNLKIAPCRYCGTPYLNNMVICAHNYNTHFGRIKNLEVGDTVIFTDTVGNEFHYTVAKSEILKPFDSDLMVAGDWALTLFTCTLGGATRVTVRCESADSPELAIP